MPYGRQDQRSTTRLTLQTQIGACAGSRFRISGELAVGQVLLLKDARELGRSNTVLGDKISDSVWLTLQTDWAQVRGFAFQRRNRDWSRSCICECA
jgi:hypothetical protein